MADSYHPNDPWALEGAFLVAGDWGIGECFSKLALRFVQDLCNVRFAGAMPPVLWLAGVDEVLQAWGQHSLNAAAS